jgi:hypothetical protein
MASLKAYQVPHADMLEASLIANKIAVDGSDPGVGKTYTAADVARRMGYTVLVVCPKVSIPMWKRVLESFGVPFHDVVNYEKLRTGNTPWGKWDKRIFRWSLPKGSLLIWDEAHRCKAKDSQNAKMLRDARGITMMLLSATFGKDPMDLRAVAHVTGIADWSGFWSWLMHNGCKKGRFGFEFDTGRTDVLTRLHKELFVKRGGRIRIADLGDQFPETQVTAEALDFGDIQKVYDEMEAELLAVAEAVDGDKERAAAREDKLQPITILLRARQKVELLKVPGIASLAQDFLDDGKSVVIFTNFRATLDSLCEKFKTTCAIFGDQNPAQRQQAIDDFQANRSRIIIVNIKAGGVSLSLHDVNQTNPRVSLICPTFSAEELRQAIGRIHREGGTKTLQRILFAAGSIEEKICDAVDAKLIQLDLLNDGDLDPTKNNLNVPQPTVSIPLPMPPEENIRDKKEVSLAETVGLGNPETLTVPVDHLSKPPVENPLEHQNRAHSKHSPSSLENKAKCEGWFNMPGRDTTAADRGSLGHLMVEKNNFTLAPDDADLTNAALKCRDFLSQFKGLHMMELKMPIQDQFGHLDHLYLQEDNSADIVDLKYARSIYGADTAQFWAYMIGVWDAFPYIQTIRVYVLHPFIDHIDYEVFHRSQHYSKLNAVVRKIIENATNPNPDNFHVGKQCAWCGRIAKCKAWALLGIEIANRANKDGEKYELPAGGRLDGEDIDPATLAVLWRIAPLIKTVSEAWRALALHKRMDEGIDIPGTELFEKKGTRSITNALAAYDAVKDKLSPTEFIEACDVKITALEEAFKEKFPRGEKGASKEVLTGLLLDAAALTSGAPVHMLRESKQ